MTARYKSLVKSQKSSFTTRCRIARKKKLLTATTVSRVTLGWLSDWLAFIWCVHNSRRFSLLEIRKTEYWRDEIYCACCKQLLLNGETLRSGSYTLLEEKKQPIRWFPQHLLIQHWGLTAFGCFIRPKCPSAERSFPLLLYWLSLWGRLPPFTTALLDGWVGIVPVIW